MCGSLLNRFFKNVSFVFFSFCAEFFVNRFFNQSKTVFYVPLPVAFTICPKVHIFITLIFHFLPHTFPVPEKNIQIPDPESHNFPWNIPDLRIPQSLLPVFFHLQSNLKTKDVVWNKIITGSMTVSGTFYKNKLPDHKRKLCLCADRKYLTAVRRGRQDDSQLGSIFEELFL